MTEKYTAYKIEDFLKVINLGREQPDIDYKESIQLEGEKKPRAEITKDIVALANSGGGLIIGGVKESPNGFLKIGMPQSELKGFDSTRVNQFVNNYCDPPINCTTIKIEDNGRTFGIIIIPEFVDQPHIITRNFSEVFSEGDIFIRTNNNESKRIGPHELRELLNRALARKPVLLQKLLQSALPLTQPQIIDNSGSTTKIIPFDIQKALERYKGFRIVTIFPEANYPTIYLPNLKGKVDLSIIKEKSSGYGSFPPAAYFEGNETRLPVGILMQGENSDFNRLNASFFSNNGVVFCIASLWEDDPGSRQPEGALGVLSCVRFLFESLLFSAQYFNNLGFHDDLRYKFSVESTVARHLVLDSNRYVPFFHSFSNPMEIPVSVSKNVKSNLKLRDIEQITIEMMQNFFWYFHYDVEEPKIQQFIDYIKENYTSMPKFFIDQMTN